jgi:hypothetical protein
MQKPVSSLASGFPRKKEEAIPTIVRDGAKDTKFYLVASQKVPDVVLI